MSDAVVRGLEDVLAERLELDLSRSRSASFLVQLDPIIMRFTLALKPPNPRGPPPLLHSRVACLLCFYAVCGLWSLLSSLEMFVSHWEARRVGRSFKTAQTSHAFPLGRCRRVFPPVGVAGARMWHTHAHTHTPPQRRPPTTPPSPSSTATLRMPAPS